MANAELPAAVGDQGTTASGVPITDELVDRLAAKAAEGHDAEQMLLRREGPPTHPEPDLNPRGNKRGFDPVAPVVYPAALQRSGGLQVGSAGGERFD
jgi:hypothetical protein